MHISSIATDVDCSDGLTHVVPSADATLVHAGSGYRLMPRKGGLTTPALDGRGVWELLEAVGHDCSSLHSQRDCRGLAANPRDLIDTPTVRTPERRKPRNALHPSHNTQTIYSTT